MCFSKQDDNDDLTFCGFAGWKMILFLKNFRFEVEMISQKKEGHILAFLTSLVKKNELLCAHLLEK